MTEHGTGGGRRRSAVMTRVPCEPRHVAYRSGQSGQNDPTGCTMQSWQVQEAKARFSELMRDTVVNGPQAITVRGRRTAVVLSVQDYDRLKRPRSSLTEFLRKSPLVGIELDIERDRSPPRDVDL